MDSQSSVVVQTRSHKRRRSDPRAVTCTEVKDDDCSTAESCCTTSGESCCTTSGESSGDESDSFEDVELAAAVEEDETASAAKRRRRADLDGLKKSVRRMEVQVGDASAQLRDLAALVAQVVAQQQQQLQFA